MNDIELFAQYRQIQSLIDRIKRVSFYADQTQKRYPLPEAMSREDLENLIKVYIALFLDFEEVYNEYKKMYDGYNRKNSYTK